MKGEKHKKEEKKMPAMGKKDHHKEKMDEKKKHKK